MTIRNVVLGLAVLVAVSVWAWCRPGSTAKAHSVEPITVTSDETVTGGNHDEALARYRTSQSAHWRQVTLKR